MNSFTRHTPAPPEQRYRERMDRTASTMDQVRQQPKPSVSMEGSTTGPVPKTEPKRNPHLLAMAKGMPCLMLIPGVCTGDRATTVSAHSNLGIHGKAKARKADDQYSVWSCGACHSWLDQGPATAAEKEAAFMAAHSRQVVAWQGIAAYTPFIKDRDAARWALDQLGSVAA